jgi:hypothetical protein
MPKSSTPATPYDKAQSIIAVEACINKLGLRAFALAVGLDTNEIYRWRAKGATLHGALRAEIAGVCPKGVMRPDVTPLGWQRETYRGLADGSLTVNAEGDLALGTTLSKLMARGRMRARAARIRRADA